MDVNPRCSANFIGSTPNLFLILLQILFNRQCSLTEYVPRDYFPVRSQSNVYDYIVIGGGTTGSIVASRLSENKLWKVLLIEGGGDPPVESSVPSLAGDIGKSKYDWQMPTETSTNFGRGFRGAPSMSGGKMMGGSGNMDNMAYQRGLKSDYDQWEALGNDGWGYEDLLPIFERIESKMEIAPSVSDDQVRFVIADAVKEFGYSFVTEFDKDHRLGYTSVMSTIQNGQRQSSARAYLGPAANRKNFHVVKSAQVTKLFMKGNSVQGVDFRRRGHLYRALARKEVILCGGATASPQILMLSGIGPKKQLEKFRIPVVKDSPVGQSLEDHVSVTLFLALSTYPFNQGYPADKALDDTFTYLKSFSGPLASSGADFVGYLNTKEGATAATPNALQTHTVFEPRSPKLAAALRKEKYQEKHVLELLALNRNATIVFVTTILTNPKSVGKIELRSKDPERPPKISPNFLENEEDLQVLGEALSFQYSLEATASFKAAGAKFHFFEDLDCPDSTNQEYLECYARLFSTSKFNPVGTARMGPDSDPRAVVNSELLVRGVRNLRVCDTSIIPVIPSTTSNAPSLIIAERCADLIKGTVI